MLGREEKLGQQWHCYHLNIRENAEQLGGCPHVTEELCQGHSADKETGKQDSGPKWFQCPERERRGWKAGRCRGGVSQTETGARRARKPSQMRIHGPRMEFRGPALPHTPTKPSLS